MHIKLGLGRDIISFGHMRGVCSACRSSSGGLDETEVDTIDLELVLWLFLKTSFIGL